MDSSATESIVGEILLSHIKSRAPDCQAREKKKASEKMTAGFFHCISLERILINQSEAPQRKTIIKKEHLVIADQKKAIHNSQQSVVVFDATSPTESNSGVIKSNKLPPPQF